MTNPLPAVVGTLVLVVGGCAMLDRYGEDPAPETSSTTSQTEQKDEPVKPKPKPEPARTPLADAAAREACLTYERAAIRLMDPTDEITDGELVTEMQAVAANAMVAEDPLLEAAADALFTAAQEVDPRAFEQAARVFVEECRRLVPEHRLTVPTL